MYPAKNKNSKYQVMGPNFGGAAPGGGMNNPSNGSGAGGGSTSDNSQLTNHNAVKASA